IRATTWPRRTRVPKSTACSTRRPGTLTPRTTVSSAASAPVDATVRGTRCSTAWNTLTARGAAAAGFSGAAAAEADAVGWPVQPAAAATTASRANQERSIRQIIPQERSGLFPTPDSLHHGDRAHRRAVGAFDSQRQRDEPTARGPDPVEVGEVLDHGHAGRKEYMVRRALLGCQLHGGLEDRRANRIVGRIVVADGLNAPAHQPFARRGPGVRSVAPELLALHADFLRPVRAQQGDVSTANVPGVLLERGRGDLGVVAEMTEIDHRCLADPLIHRHSGDVAIAGQ